MADVRLTATNPEDSSVVPVACDASGRLLLEEQGQGPQGPEGPPGPKGDDGDPFSGNFAGNVTFGGSATFAGDIAASRLFARSPANTVGLQIANADNSNKTVCNLYGSGNVEIGTDIGSNGPNINLNNNGSASFAGNKAGFTSEGYLWCTTERGDTVMLEATVGGAGMWKAYTPPREAIKDKLESIVDIDNPRQSGD